MNATKKSPKSSNPRPVEFVTRRDGDGKVIPHPDLVLSLGQPLFYAFVCADLWRAGAALMKAQGNYRCDDRPAIAGGLMFIITRAGAVRVLGQLRVGPEDAGLAAEEGGKAKAWQSCLARDTMGFGCQVQPVEVPDAPPVDQVALEAWAQEHLRRALVPYLASARGHRRVRKPSSRREVRLAEGLVLA